MKHVCIIGGSRYFGKRLIRRLLDTDVQVTVVNRGSSPAPAGADHVIADRDDEAALRAALGERGFDVVFDQVCYTPTQAAIARRVFDGRVGRYVLTSTIEVYDPASAAAITPATPGHPVAEDAVDPRQWPVDPHFVEDNYGEGKRQAEAVLAADPALNYVAVRTAHVLGGADDFTGRLAHYVERIRDGRPIAIHPTEYASVFTNEREIVDFLVWVAGADVTGPINACSHGELTVTDVCDIVAERVGKRPMFEVTAAAERSPFSFDRYYAMDNGLASRLGFPFAKTTDWLPDLITP